MTTPIWDFVRRYAQGDTARLHMPGHKGVPFLGCEPLDITEISGTEELIPASEANAAALFGSGRTVYATGGSSQCVRAMVYLAVTAAGGAESDRLYTGGTAGGAESDRLYTGGTAGGAESDRLYTGGTNGNPLTGRPRPVIVAARNAHKSLLYAAALCDAELVWLWPEAEAEPDSVSVPTSSLCACPVTADQVRRTLEGLSRAGRQAAAVYVTSPDYLGGVQDLPALSEAAHRYGVPLLVDNAHGAYLKFLPKQQGPNCPNPERVSRTSGQETFSRAGGACTRAPGQGTRNLYAHPLDLGADLCCDSAHKTLPVLTGGAYLHTAKTAPASFRENARAAMDLFGSTSPSWLILASLDHCNGYLSENYAVRLRGTVRRLDALRDRLRGLGWTVWDSDPLRLTLRGDGPAMADRLRRGGVEWEYADRDFLVLMATPENPPSDFDRIAAALGRCTVPPPPLPVLPPVRGEAVLTPRQAVFAPQERVSVETAVGRICAAPAVACPPAIPVAVSGERIPPEAVHVFRYYGIDSVDVVKDSGTAG